MRVIRYVLITGLFLCSQIRANQNEAFCSKPELCNKKSTSPITLLYPIGGEVFSCEDTIKIVWEYDSLQVAFMGVFFSLDSGKTWKEILDTRNVRSRDSLLWIPSETNFDFSGKGIKIRVKDYGSINSDESDYFTIVKDNGVTFQQIHTVDKIKWTIQSNTFRIYLDRTTQPLHLLLYSCNGRLVKWAQIPHGVQGHTISLADISPGYYCITLNDSHKTVILNKSFIITH